MPFLKVHSNLRALLIWKGRSRFWFWYEFGNNSKEYDTSKELEKKKWKFMVRKSLKEHCRLIQLWWKRREEHTQRFPLRKPSEFKALWVRSKNDILSIKPAAKPFMESNAFSYYASPCKSTNFNYRLHQTVYKSHSFEFCYYFSTLNESSTCIINKNVE